MAKARISATGKLLEDTDEKRAKYIVDDPIDKILYGTGLLENTSLAPDRESLVRDHFLVPPFSVIDGSNRWWLERRRAWHSLGFDSVAGRPLNMLNFSAAMIDAGGGIPVGRFDPVLCELAYRWWCPAGGTILDPFSGGSVRGIVAEVLGCHYVGVDLREEQVTENLQQAHALDLNPTYHVGDSRNFAELVGDVEGDFVFSSPPYFWREHHCDLAADLNNSKSYPQFLESYRQTIRSVVSRLKTNRFACFEVAETRNPKDGIAPNFIGDTITAFVDAGAKLYNHAIHLKSTAGAQIRINRIFAHSLKLIPIHEHVLVFIKGDSKKAAAACKTGKDYLVSIEDESERDIDIIESLPQPITPITLTPKTDSPIRPNDSKPMNAAASLFDLLNDEPPVETPVPPALVDVTAPVEVAPVGFVELEPRLSAAPVTLVPRGHKPASVVTLAAPAPRKAYDDPFLAHHVKTLRLAGNAKIHFGAFDNIGRGAVALDCEVYCNFFVVCFQRFSDNTRCAHEMSARSEVDRGAIKSILENNITVSFNGLSYDLAVLEALLAGADNAALYELSQSIIKRNERPRLDNHWNHVDLSPVLPQGRRSLKEVWGRLHGRFLVDLPYPPNAELTLAQMNVATLYCFNDLDALEGLRTALHGPLGMRTEMGRRYDIDLRSKSDAQMGEAIVHARLGKVGTPDTDRIEFSYSPPKFISFAGGELRSVVERLSSATFSAHFGDISPPDWLKELRVTIGSSVFQMGIGGLHSMEECRALRSDDKSFLLDVDASSQYPMIILRLGLSPPAAGPDFLSVYESIVKERLEAKDAGDRVRADGLKTSVNGVFGKLGSGYSFLYSPQMLVAVTLTGQLSLLMLAERAEAAGVQAVSANTDGVTLLCPRGLENALDELLSGWESDVGMTLERTRYDALYQRDVNTYIALKEGGGTKRKGWLANPWAEGDTRGMLSKNPQMTVLSDAAVALLAEGVPVEESISACSDPRAFVTLIKVTGGASWRGKPLGRAVRWYWSTDGDPVVYSDSGHRVGKTEGAKPLMEMTDVVPKDLDRAKYIQEAHQLLVDIGAERKPGLL